MWRALFDYDAADWGKGVCLQIYIGLQDAVCIYVLKRFVGR